MIFSFRFIVILQKNGAAYRKRLAEKSNSTSAAYPTPLGRMVVLNRLSELVRLPDGSVILFGGSEKGDGSVELYGMDFLQEFELEDGLPVWRYKINDTVIEKRVYLLHIQNTVHINYKVIQGEEKVRLKLQPAINFRSHDAPVTEGPGQPYVFSAVTNRYQISAGALERGAGSSPDEVADSGRPENALPGPSRLPE